MWRLVAVAEVDVAVADDRFAVRVEVLAGAEGHFRCRTYRQDLYRIQTTHPLDVWGAPNSPPVDEAMWVAWPDHERGALEIAAPDVDRALDHAAERVRARVNDLNRRRG